MKIATPLIPSWIHSLADYQQMFALSDQDLTMSLLDYPAGISSFNAEMMALGHTVVSADPHYHLAPIEMSKLVDKIIQSCASQLEAYSDRLISHEEKTHENILNAWHQYAQQFLADYSVGKKNGRYIKADLPKLPFANMEFDIAICSDLLFRDSSSNPLMVIMELCRVAKQVRVFPLLNHSGEVASELGVVLQNLQEKNYGVEIKEVPYKLQKGNNAMLRIWAQECVVAL